MSWIKQNENSYIHDIAPFTLQLIGGAWFVVDSRDQSKAIPFNDIFNNPVYSIDFSNETILAKHFRAEAANTPNSPGYSFQSDSNTGFYHISDGIVGFSSNGTKRGEFGSDYGGFNGNIIQVISGTQNFQTVISTISFQNINSASGVVWETSIVPKLANSRIFILYYLSVNNSANFSGYRISNKINAGSYSVIYNPQLTSTQGALSTGSLSGNYSMLAIPVLHSPSYVKGDTLTYKVEGSSYDVANTQTTNLLRTGAGANSGHSEVYIMEIANI
jgi:hypothetical protein